jgi:hypothetical protein
MVDVNARVLHAHVLGADGGPADRLPQGEPLELDILLAAARALDRPRFGLQVRAEDGTAVFGFTRRLPGQAAEGAQVRLAGRVENPLAPGRYVLDMFVTEDVAGGGTVLQGLQLAQFTIDGSVPERGVVRVRAEVDAVIEEPS